MEPRVVLTIKEAEEVLKKLDKESDLYKDIKEQILNARGL